MDLFDQVKLVLFLSSVNLRFLTIEILTNGISVVFQFCKIKIRQNCNHDK